MTLKSIAVSAAMSAVILILPTRPARALGFCEGLSEVYRVDQVSESKGLFALVREKEFCKETEVGELSHTLKYVAITTAKGKPALLFAGDESDETWALAKRRLGKKARPHAELAPYLAENGFVKPTPIWTPTAKGCVGKVVQSPTNGKSGAYRVSIHVVLGEKVLAQLPVGKGVDNAGAEPRTVNAFWFAAKPGVVMDYLMSTDEGFQDRSIDENGQPIASEPTIYDVPFFRVAGDKALTACF